MQEAENHIAFYATLTAHTTLGPKQTIEFDHIITNIGRRYNGVSGIFTVPITGIYQFSTTMFQYTSSQHEIHTQLMKNNISVGQNFGNSNRASATQAVIVLAHRGDIVYVRHHEIIGSTQVIFGQGYSSFSGFLISLIYDLLETKHGVIVIFVYLVFLVVSLNPAQVRCTRYNIMS